MKKKLNQSEEKCFQVLYDEYENEYILTFKTIANEADFTLLQTKRAVRALVRQGLVKRETAFDEDGIIRGSGFIMTYEAYRDKFNSEQHP